MKNRNLRRFAMPRRSSSEGVVQDNLSYTPTQMMLLAEKGIPVTTANQAADSFFDGVPIGQGSFELPLDQQRGIDVADTWQASQLIRKKAKSGLINDIRQFGAYRAPQKGE